MSYINRDKKAGKYIYVYKKSFTNMLRFLFMNICVSCLNFININIKWLLNEDSWLLNPNVLKRTDSLHATLMC